MDSLPTSQLDPLKQYHDTFLHNLDPCALPTKVAKALDDRSSSLSCHSAIYALLLPSAIGKRNAQIRRSPVTKTWSKAFLNPQQNVGQACGWSHSNVRSWLVSEDEHIIVYLESLWTTTFPTHYNEVRLMTSTYTRCELFKVPHTTWRRIPRSEEDLA